MSYKTVATNQQPDVTPVKHLRECRFHFSSIQKMGIGAKWNKDSI